MQPGVENPYNRLEVDLDVIAANLAGMRQRLPTGTRVAAVVKADAYGHGMVPVSKRLVGSGADALAVAVWTEGRALREEGFTCPILVMLGCEPAEAGQLAELGLTPVVGRVDTLAALEEAGRALGRPVECQVKVDTGMGRLGLEPAEVPAVLERYGCSGHLKITGLVSHLATSGVPDSTFADDQAGVFDRLLGGLRKAGHKLADSSLWASGGLLIPPRPAPRPPGLVRLGISLYGGLPDAGSGGVVRLATAMRFSSRLIQVKRVAQGAPVSYGCTWSAPCDALLGVIPVGYADGYLRSGSNRARVLVGGRWAPVRGRICMNLTMVDLTDHDPAPQPGDEVVLLGSQGSRGIILDELAEWAGTIGYEVSCALGRSNPRHYLPA